MNKGDIVNRVSMDTTVEKCKVESVIDAFMETVVAALGKGDDVHLQSFGIFKVNEHKERKGRNPKTGEAVLIPAKKAVKFRPSRTFTDIVNK